MATLFSITNKSDISSAADAAGIAEEYSVAY
jgi:hypothetical protein